MENEFEYYVAYRNNDNAIPLLASDTGNPHYLYQSYRIENPEVLLFKLGKPIPKKPKMADYLSSPESVVSKKIFDVLSPLNVEGTQLLPARIRGKDDQLFTDYWAIHIYNKIKCVDEKLSDCKIESSGLGYVRKLVLDKKVLKTMPLSQRLIFRLKEDSGYEIFHVSIVEAILAANPDGIRFVNVEEWNDGSFFQN